VKLVVTGGHHSSALPVIKRIKNISPEVRIYWVGHKRSLKGDENDTLEYTEISSLGIPFYDLKAGKVYRTLDPARLIRIPIGFFQSLILLLKLKPDVILSFGGYLAAPVVLAGYILGIPSITHEQTVVAGYANKFISFFAKKILISWPQSERIFPKNKTLLTGIPIREGVTQVLSSSFSTNNSLPTVFIMGGKTGSHILNVLVKNNLRTLLSGCNVIHICGDNSIYKDYELLSDLYSDMGGKTVGKYFPRKFIFENEIGEAYKKSDLVVSRAGAHAIAELLAIQKPCILIPIPWVSHNEQHENALLLERAGLAKVIEEKDCSNGYFIGSIKEALSNIQTFTLKDDSLMSLLKSDSAEIIADETIKLAQKH
jgi:UDP-N-acetylglucosamine--N-acetylmuramyl-(pentapeptide) pyrophosphoryl-undecaprenol N-acetylglucosamine transferase